VKGEKKMGTKERHFGVPLFETAKMTAKKALRMRECEG